MSTASPNKRYLTLDNVRVFHDRESDIVRLTCTDDDIPNGDFSITLKTGTRTDEALRTLMIQKGVMEKPVDFSASEPSTDALITILGNPKNASTIVTGRSDFIAQFTDSLATAAKSSDVNVIRINDTRSNFIDGVEYVFSHLSGRTIVIFNEAVISAILTEYQNGEKEITRAAVARFKELSALESHGVQIVVGVANPRSYGAVFGKADNFVAFRPKSNDIAPLTHSLLDSFGLTMQSGYERIYQTMYDGYYLTLSRGSIVVGASDDYEARVA